MERAQYFQAWAESELSKQGLLKSDRGPQSFFRISQWIAILLLHPVGLGLILGIPKKFSLMFLWFIGGTAL